MKLSRILLLPVLLIAGMSAYSQENEETPDESIFEYGYEEHRPTIEFLEVIYLDDSVEEEPDKDNSQLLIQPLDIVIGGGGSQTGPPHRKGPDQPTFIDLTGMPVPYELTHTFDMAKGTNGYEGYSHRDVHYKIRPTSRMNLKVSLRSGIITPQVQVIYAYLVRASDYAFLGTNMQYESNRVPTYSPTFIIKDLPVDTYYLIIEPAANAGTVTTTITQTAPGSNPYIIELGSKKEKFTYTHTQDTRNTPHVYGHTTHDVYYKFNLSVPMEVEFSHCGSALASTHMYLLNAFHQKIAESDKSTTNVCSNTSQAYLKTELSRGTYYLVSEGCSANGSIKTTFSGKPVPEPISIGTKSGDFYYTHTQNTNSTYSYNAYEGRPTNDVFYKLTLSKPMDIIISHCGSEVADTYVHLLDANYNRITYNDDYSGIGACGKTTHAYLKKENLAAGTYYIVSEGYSQNGYITTTIEGYSPKISTAIKSKTSTESYVQTLRPLVATPDATGLTLADCMQTVQYVDGFARPTQTIQAGIVESGYNLVSQTEYDEFGRESKQWLPFRSTSSTAARETSFQSSSTSFHGDTHPYTEIEYDNPALSRVVKTTGPGKNWHLAGKGITQEYTFNTASGVLSADCYTVSSDGTLSKGAAYPPGELHVEKVTDEDGNVSYLFTDKSGQVILERQMNGTQQINTYYVYDDLGRKRYVLPPMMEGSVDTDDLDKYAYSYHYDERGNCTQKKLPGAEPVYYVYDKARRLILSQDGNQRQKAADLFTITVYDKLARVAYTAEGKFGKHTDLVEHWKDQVMSENFSAKAQNHPLGDAGYTKSNYPQVSFRLLTVNYYDTYDFLNLPAASSYKSSLTYAARSGYGTSHSVATGMLTGMRVYDSESEATYTITAYYYDYKADEIQVLSTNFLENGIEKNYYKRGFTGNVEFHLKENTATGKDKITELYEYRYDQGLRVKKVIHQINNQQKVILAENKYNSLGVLSSKSVHNGKHTTTYDYNIRGWTTDINGTHFKQKLSYDNYNGNISFYTWRVSTEGFTRMYSFTYDGLNRIKQATYGEEGTGSRVYNNNYTVIIDGYDKQGNIGKLRRYGAYLPFDGNLATIVSTPAKHKYIDIIDNLTMSYNGNQLTKVVENATKDPVYNGVMHFSGGSTATIQYTYDKNGNMISDANKKITKISYNNLNQATQIDFSQDKKYRTKYSYDGSGRKYKTEYLVYSLTTTGPSLPGGGIGIGIASSSPGLPGVVLPPPISVIEPYRVQSTIDYCGNIIYRDGELDKILTQEGYVDRASDGSFQYHYYLRDHQGNNRVVITQNSGVEQVNHYYPFGALFGDSQDKSGQPYKFGGKELDRMFGLDWFDFHARSVDGPLGRTPTPDPMAEKYYSISPYVYCMNNPIRYVDPDGMDVWSTDDPEEIQRFMDAMRFRPSRQKTESFNYKKWDNVTDKEIEEASESLFYDDEEMLFYMGNDPGMNRFAFEDKKGYATIRASYYLEGGNISQVNVGFDLLAGASTAKLVKSLGTEFIKLFVKTNAKRTIEKGSYTITKTVANNLSSRPYINSPSTIKNIMQSSKGIPDAFYKGGVNYKAPGNFNGSNGLFELGINPKTNTIYHFLFKSTK